MTIDYLKLVSSWQTQILPAKCRLSFLEFRQAQILILLGKKVFTKTLKLTLSKLKTCIFFPQTRTLNLPKSKCVLINTNFDFVGTVSQFLILTKQNSTYRSQI